MYAHWQMLPLHFRHCMAKVVQASSRKQVCDKLRRQSLLDSTVGGSAIALHAAVAPVPDLPDGSRAGGRSACACSGQLRACKQLTALTKAAMR